MSVVLTALNGHTFSFHYTLQNGMLWQEMFQYLSSTLFLTKKYTKPSICICFPPGKFISLKKYMYSKELYNNADSPTYVEYQQTLLKKSQLKNH